MKNYTISTQISWSQTMNDLKDEFRKWGISEWDCNVPRGYRLTSWSQSEDDRTVILSFFKDGKEVVLKYGKQSRAVDNLRALYLTINDMRMTEVRGVNDLVESAYKQLGSGAGDTHVTPKVTDPYEILGIRPDSPKEVAEAVYRSLASKYHPDSKPDGSAEMMARLNDAIAQIRGAK